MTDTSFALGTPLFNSFDFDGQVSDNNSPVSTNTPAVINSNSALLQINDTIVSLQNMEGSNVCSIPISPPPLIKPEPTSNNINGIISIATATTQFVNQFNDFAKQFLKTPEEAQQSQPSSFLHDVQQQLGNLTEQQLTQLGNKPPEELEAMVMYAIINPQADVPAPVKNLAAQITAKAEENTGNQLSTMDRVAFNQTIDEGYNVFFEKALENSGLPAVDQNKVAFAHYMPEYANSLPSNLKVVLQRSEAASKTELQKSMGVPASWTPPNGSKIFEAKLGLTYQHGVSDKLLEMRNNGQISQEQYNELRTLFFNPEANTPHAATLLPMLKQVAGEQLNAIQKDAGFPDGYTPPTNDASWNNMLTGAFYQTCQASIKNQNPPLSASDQAQLLAALTSPQARLALSPALKTALQGIEMEAASSVKQAYALPNTWMPSTSALNEIGKSSPLQSLLQQVTHNAIDQMQERINIATKNLDSPAAKAVLTPDETNSYKNFLKVVGMALNEFREGNYTASVKDGEIGHILNNIQHEAKMDQLEKQRNKLEEIQEKMKKMATMGPMMMAIIMVFLFFIMIALIIATMGAMGPAAAAMMQALQQAMQAAMQAAMSAATAAVEATVTAASSVGGAEAGVEGAATAITEATMQAITSSSTEAAVATATASFNETMQAVVTSAANAAYATVVEGGGSTAAAQAAATAAAETVGTAAGEAAAEAAISIAASAAQSAISSVVEMTGVSVAEAASSEAVTTAIAEALANSTEAIATAALNAATATATPAGATATTAAGFAVTGNGAAAAAAAAAAGACTISTEMGALIIITSVVGFIMTGMSMDTGHGSGLSKILEDCHASKQVIQGFTMAFQIFGAILMMGAGFGAMMAMPAEAMGEATAGALERATQNVLEGLGESTIGKMAGPAFQNWCKECAAYYAEKADENFAKVWMAKAGIKQVEAAEEVAKGEFEAIERSMINGAERADADVPEKMLKEFIDKLHECAQQVSTYTEEQDILLNKITSSPEDQKLLADEAKEALKAGKIELTPEQTARLSQEDQNRLLELLGKQKTNLSKAEQARFSELLEKSQEPERYFKELFDKNKAIIEACGMKPEELQQQALDITKKVAKYSVPHEQAMRELSNTIAAATEGSELVVQIAEAGPKMKNSIIEAQVARIRADMEADQVLIDQLVKAFKALIDKLLNGLKGFTSLISDTNQMQQKMYREASSTFSNACDAMRG